MTTTEKILVLGGLLALTAVAAKKAVNHFANNIQYAFQNIDKFSINLITSNIKLSLLVTNNNDFPLYIGTYLGILQYGSVVLEVARNIKTEVPAGDSAIISFNVSFDNENLLFQLADLIKEGGKPLLEIKGTLEAGLDPDNLYQLPVSQKVEIA